MKKFTKALAAIMLMTAVTFAMGCKKDKADGDGTVNGHTYVDLGLPSGTLWATCNVGADKPEDYGDYFAWGETKTKTTYKWSTYKYGNADYNRLTKYSAHPLLEYIDFIDNLTILQPNDDAATVNWGAGWRMATKEEWEELFQNTTNIWAIQNGVGGRLITAANGSSIFLPAAGWRAQEGRYGCGNTGCYWSSSLGEDDPFCAEQIYFFSGAYIYYNYSLVNRRYVGNSVRAVCSAPQN